MHISNALIRSSIMCVVFIFHYRNTYLVINTKKYFRIRCIFCCDCASATFILINVQQHIFSMKNTFRFVTRLQERRKRLASILSTTKESLINKYCIVIIRIHAICNLFDENAHMRKSAVVHCYYY